MLEGEEGVVGGRWWKGVCLRMEERDMEEQIEEQIEEEWNWSWERLRSGGATD